MTKNERCISNWWVNSCAELHRTPIALGSQGRVEVLEVELLRLSQQRLYHFAMDVGQAKITALESVG